MIMRTTGAWLIEEEEAVVVAAGRGASGKSGRGVGGNVCLKISEFTMAPPFPPLTTCWRRQFSAP
jgi:hypothetical protein